MTAGGCRRAPERRRNNPYGVKEMTRRLRTPSLHDHQQERGTLICDEEHSSTVSATTTITHSLSSPTIHSVGDDRLSYYRDPVAPFSSLLIGTMPPKEKLKVKKNSLKKNHLKKSRVILPHMVTQVAQQVGSAMYFVCDNTKQFTITCK
ncbi:hypothetical protein L195_g020526 [Trifolium pratense]|uniref:Uncharacterized protein n=1 Tax=Trifolium pratense TaxID=57577 RepID=A0A2K3N2L6_TRIPR|nr:hypothetical protein L195_g020526 [Trifolium pratense]